ncbi:hypothetical protein IWZ00DRAFT_498258 [Phyllosticta capitalensis]|uniref:Uncharacterized protein n=1 Tax=Phyllosticta capitalensis TaxID=121624 RepID=A0ABR1Z0J9_9PEZI
MLKTSTVAAALLAAAPIASAGSAGVINNCDYDVNLWTADTERGQKGPHSLSAGGSWSEEYYMVGSGSSTNGGVSIKLSTSDSCEGSITQFEYTYSSDGSPDLWYDISNVNCKGDACPFYLDGFYLDAPTTVNCGPLTAVCDAVYNEWNDDTATHGTTSSKDLTLYLCGEDGKTSNSTNYDTTSSAAPSSTYYAVSSSVSTPATSFAVLTSSATPTPTPAIDLSANIQVANVEPVSSAPPSSVNIVVTQIETEYATAYATVWAKRSPAPEPHMHHAREHHHGHPHWRK